MEVKEPVKAVLFDLDGTLLSLPINYDELRKRLREHASKFNLNYEFRRIIDDIEEASRTLGERFRRDCYEIVELYECEAALKPVPEEGARELLEKLKKSGLKVGVVSRNSKKCVTLSLERLGMAGHVDVIVGREDAKPKPSPDPLLHALKTLGVRAEETAFVGDHPYDLAAATAAGVRFIALGDKIKGYNGPRARRITEVADLIAI